MSRSIHQTIKSVFGGKSETQIDELIASQDPDVVALAAKRTTKRRVIKARAAARTLAKAERAPDA